MIFSAPKACKWQCLIIWAYLRERMVRRAFQKEPLYIAQSVSHSLTCMLFSVKTLITRKCSQCVLQHIAVSCLEKYASKSNLRFVFMMFAVWVFKKLFIVNPSRGPKCQDVSERQRGGAIVFCAMFVIGYCRLLKVIMHLYFWEEFDWTKEWLP